MSAPANPNPNPNPDLDYIGSAFIATEEANASDAYKQAANPTPTSDPYL